MSKYETYRAKNKWQKQREERGISNENIERNKASHFGIMIENKTKE